MEVFPYLSVLVSIIIGLGISHLLKAVVRILHHRARTKIYVPSLLWAANLLLLFTLVWWADFSLNGHRHWTFAVFLATLGVPATLYVVSGLVLPATESEGGYDMRAAYETNRVWLLSLGALAIALSFAQTFLLDGHVNLDEDAWLKALLMLITLIAVFVKDAKIQYLVAIANLTWVVVYIVLLFSNLRT